jgi:pimeloyl-ACP methyl ester carboxylesterase
MIRFQPKQQSARSGENVQPWARAIAALLVFLASACSFSPEPVTVLDLLQPCSSEEGPVDALCGTVEVFEDRQAQAGRKIPLKVVVLPAVSNDPRPDPLFILAGGPGMGAAENASLFKRAFERTQINRDIVLVDQRGTGESNPLDCELPEEKLEALSQIEEYPVEEFRACLEGYDADASLYTTSVAMDDLDDVRSYLRYEKINLYGGSYGTRAGLVYLRRHAEHVRTVILDGVAPPDMKLPVSAPLDGQRALDLLLADCEADAACNERFPGLREKVDGLLTRLEKQRPKVRVQHPRTGEWAEVEIGRALVANALFGAFYSPLTSSLVPLLIERAEQNDFQPLMAMTFASEDLGDLLSQGMFLSVICSEDVPRVTDEDRSTAGESFLGSFFEQRLKPCEFWPKAEVSEKYYEPVKSDLPVLILSGQLDPITPPRWGEHIAEHLPNSKHLVVPGVGHGAMGQGCVTRLVSRFLDEGTAANLDAGCIEQLRRPPFFVSATGPRPGNP